MVGAAGDWPGGRQEEEEDAMLVRAMEEYEENLAQSRRVIDITECQHIFRHVSEWDPRTRESVVTVDSPLHNHESIYMTLSWPLTYLHYELNMSRTECQGRLLGGIHRVT